MTKVRRGDTIIDLPDDQLATLMLPGDEVGFDLTEKQRVENADWIKRGAWDVDMPRNRDEFLDWIETEGLSVAEACALPVVYWHVDDPDKEWLKEICGGGDRDGDRSGR
jgi:hypothetical protein